MAWPKGKPRKPATDTGEPVGSGIAEAMDDSADRSQPLPSAVRLLQPFGYWTDDGRLVQWVAGQIEDVPEKVADLIARKAPIEGV